MTKIQLLLTYMIVLANSCSYLYNNTIFLTGALKEVINVPLSSIFHSNYYERLTLKQTNNFLTITTPIQKYQEVIIGGVSNTKTVSQKLKKTTNSRDPLNHIIILTVIGETYYAESNKGNYLNLPQIEVIEKIIKDIYQFNLNLRALLNKNQIYLL